MLIMDLERYFVEANRKKRIRGRWRSSGLAIALHALLIGAFVLGGAQTAKHTLAAEKPIALFITRGAAPPPPPPPPPPKSAGAVKSTPRVESRPVEVRPQTLIAPTEIPKELPEVTPLVQPTNALPEATAGVAEDTGVEGGVTGGVDGGVLGGVTGGVVGGEVGGEIGGVVGGQLGGTGTGTEGTGSGGDELPLAPEAPPPPPPPPPPAPTAPLRVGGDVKAPVVIERADPLYTETARKARVAGTVIVEAIINKSGRVEDVRVVKGLPMGLSVEAEQAVKKWRFKPGTLNGVPVATIFNLTVTFKLN